MAGGKGKRGGELPANTNGWMLTFSDCMTLLLCFFVMLLSFSSFDEEKFGQLSGAFNYDSFQSIFPIPRQTPDSLLKPARTFFDFTKEGSRIQSREHTDQPAMPRQQPIITDLEAYKDRRVVYIPSDRMFWGDGVGMKPDGRRLVNRIASFAQLIPCHLVIGESRQAEPGPASDLSMQRAAAVVTRLVTVESLPSNRLSVSGSDSGAAARHGGEPVVEVWLLTRRSNP